MIWLSRIYIYRVIANTNSLPCCQAGSPFIHKDHGHILTGDLLIIKNNKLRKLTCKSPKHRHSKGVDFTSAKNNILEGIDKCIETGNNNKGLLEILLALWKSKASEYNEKTVKLQCSNICPRKNHTSWQLKDLIIGSLLHLLVKQMEMWHLFARAFFHSLCLKNFK